jgi:DNA primase
MGEIEIKLQGIRDTYIMYTEFLSKIMAFYRHSLESQLAIKNYLKVTRRFKQSTISKFQIGFSPGTKSLLRFVEANNLKIQFLVDTGILIDKGNEDYYDRFTGRIIFPLHDITGNIIGFSGRVTPETEKREKEEKGKVRGKFINTSTTLIYKKRFVLYGLNFALDSIIQRGFAIVVEGIPDTISMQQNEFTNTVGPSGTALTLEHMYLLKSITKNLLVSMDDDKAGKKAYERVIELNKEVKLNVKKLNTLGGKDLDEYLKSNNPAFLQKTIHSIFPY